MRTYDDALALVGSSEPASSAGGWRRYVTFEQRYDDIVAARMFRTDIVTWHRDGTIVLDTGGWRTLSTFDGMATALGIQRACVGLHNHVPHYRSDREWPGTPFDDGRTFTIEPKQSA